MDETNHNPSTPETTTIGTTHLNKKHSPFTRFFLLIILISFPSLYASKASQLALAFRSPRPPIVPVKDAWASYLNARVAEWKVVFALACLLVGLSLAMYQIQQAVSDPFTYAFISLTQCRAFSGLMYAVVLLIYFGNEYTHTASFAMVWWKIATGPTNNIWNTWIMLSLPIASTIWALFFYLLATISFIFRPTTPTLHYQSIPFALNITLQVVIVILIIWDLVCVVYIWVTFKRYGEKCHTNSEENSEV